MLKERGSFQWENEKTSLGMASIKPGTPTAKRKQPLAMEVKEKEAREREKEKDSTQKQWASSIIERNAVGRRFHDDTSLGIGDSVGDEGWETFHIVND